MKWKENESKYQIHVEVIKKQELTFWVLHQGGMHWDIQEVIVFVEPLQR